MKNILFALFFALSLASIAQKKKAVDPKYIYWYKETSLETDDYKIYIVDAQNGANYTKFKIRIFNKTNDYLIFKPSECSFLIGSQDISSKDKQIIVPPNDETSRVIDAKGKECQVDKFTLEIKTYYKADNNSPGLVVEDFVLPPAKNDFKAGPFNCKHLDNKLKTDKSTVKFGCTYQGDGIGIIESYKCSATMPNGQDNANARHYEPAIVEKGKYEDFVVEIKGLEGSGDMQKQSFKIKWNETFKDSKLTSLKGSKIDLELDTPKTIAKNK